jgi:predicted nuclease of predicted toxin-antitoxin system
MPSFLIDANLPYFFNLWNSPNFIHLKDIADDMQDTEVWNYAKIHHLTIITKDADFSNRIILANPPPNVIHLRVGNLKMSALHDLITTIWKDIEWMSEKNKLIRPLA